MSALAVAVKLSFLITRTSCDVYTIANDDHEVPEGVQPTILSTQRVDALDLSTEGKPPILR